MSGSTESNTYSIIIGTLSPDILRVYENSIPAKERTIYALLKHITDT